jgi:hypothetical protein
MGWRAYHSLPLGFDAPKIEAAQISRADEKRPARRLHFYARAGRVEG